MSKKKGLKYLIESEEKRQKARALKRIVWLGFSLIIFNYGIGLKFNDKNK